MSAEKPSYPVALAAAEAPLRAKASNYPEQSEAYLFGATGFCPE